MKKFSKILIVSAVSLAFVACNKENILQSEGNQNNSAAVDEYAIIDGNKYPEISVQNGVLCFNSVEYYESITSNQSENYCVDELTEYLNSTTFKNYGKKNGEESEYDEPFMDAIMNVEKVVKIGEWFIYIDVPSEKVLAISDKEENAYASLLKQSGRNMKEFSIGDDVLDHLVNNTAPDDRSCGGIGGGIYPSYPNVYSGQIVKTFPSGVVWRLNPFVRFFRAGVYFKLSSQFEIWRFSSASAQSNGQIVSNISGNDVTIEMFVRYSQGWWKKRPCGSGDIGTQAPGYHYSESIYGNPTVAVYSGIRNLNGYYFYVQGRAKYPDGSVTSASPYGGRNINSPY